MAGKPSSPTLPQVLAKVHRRLVLFAVSLASLTLLFGSVAVMHDQVNRNLHLMARTVAYTVEPAIVFGDISAAREGMVSVATNDLIEKLVLVDPEGRELVNLSREHEGIIPASFINAGNYLLWSRPARQKVMHNEQIIAEVQVFGSAASIERFLLSGILITVCCVGIALMGTRMLARRLQTGVIAPLNHAVEVARFVRVERAFDRRVPAPGLAEVDNFVEDFNSLLAELQGWYAGLEQENEQLERKATHDMLTALGNRALFEQRIEKAIACAGLSNGCFAVLYLDGDGFKQINDCHGHDAGDVVLQAVAERLRSCIRHSDDAFRLGGDEFAIILMSPVEKLEIDLIVRRISEAMEHPIILPSGGFVNMSMSIGFSVYPDDGQAMMELLKKADRAMYDDKLRRRNDAFPC